MDICYTHKDAVSLYCRNPKTAKLLRASPIHCLGGWYAVHAEEKTTRNLVYIRF